MRRFTCIILALVLVEIICGIQTLEMDDLEQKLENRELWAELRKNHVTNLLRNYRGDAQGWAKEYGTKIYEKRANVNKWWWVPWLLCNSKDCKDNKQEPRKLKEGPGQCCRVRFCYLKVCSLRPRPGPCAKCESDSHTKGTHKKR